MYSQLSIVCRADTGQALILIKPKGLLAPLLLYSTPRPEQPCSCKRESRISLLNLILLKATLNIDQLWRYSTRLVLQSAGVLVPEPAWVMIGCDGLFWILRRRPERGTAMKINIKPQQSMLKTGYRLILGLFMKNSVQLISLFLWFKQFCLFF